MQQQQQHDDASPMPRPPGDPYRLALCMAGAGSGGAYSAGVLDFLFEALSEWEQARTSAARTDAAESPQVAPWRVLISDVAGTSAGGVTAALATSTFNTPYMPNPSGNPLPDGTPASANPLYSTWVQLFNADTLFSLVDLDGSAADGAHRRTVVRSLLNGRFMSDLVPLVLPNAPAAAYAARKPWVARNATLALTSVNLRGVPYTVDSFATKMHPSSSPSSQSPPSANDVATRPSFRMMRHRDFTRFHFVDKDDKHDDDDMSPSVALDDSYAVSLGASRDASEWPRLTTAVCATAAVPIAFPCVQMYPRRSDYAARTLTAPVWPPSPRASPGVNGTGSVDVNDVEDGSRCEAYVAVDGGMLDNEPFTLLEAQVCARHDRKLSPDPRDAWASVLLVDPFPSSAASLDDSLACADDLGLAGVVAAVMGAMRTDAAFKPGEMATALDPGNMQRFMIAPRRDVRAAGGMKAEEVGGDVLATAGLGSFAGLLHVDLRQHDFLLGRRNCQRFLKEEFRIGVESARENATFAPFHAWLTAHADPTTNDVAIIPLMGKAMDELPIPQWPRYSRAGAQDIVDEVARKIARRLMRVLKVWLGTAGVIGWKTWNPLRWGVSLVMWVMAWPVRMVLTGVVQRKLMEEMTRFIVPDCTDKLL